jgi:hypothetical protein
VDCPALSKINLAVFFIPSLTIVMSSFKAPQNIESDQISLAQLKSINLRLMKMSKTWCRKAKGSERPNIITRSSTKKQCLLIKTPGMAEWSDLPEIILARHVKGCFFSAVLSRCFAAAALIFFVRPGE